MKIKELLQKFKIKEYTACKTTTEVDSCDKHNCRAILYRSILMVILLWIYGIGIMLDLF